MQDGCFASVMLKPNIALLCLWQLRVYSIIRQIQVCATPLGNTIDCSEVKSGPSLKQSHDCTRAYRLVSVLVYIDNNK